MNSGVNPVSTVCTIVPAGSRSRRMRSVSPDGIPSTTAAMDWPAVAVNGIASTSVGPVISPVVSISGAPSTAGGAEPIAPVPNMIACDLRW